MKGSTAMPPITDLDPLMLIDLREAAWVLATTHPDHEWKRRSGSPRTQLERTGYIASEVAIDRGYKGLTPQGKALYAQWARREGLPVPAPTARIDRAQRYGPPAATSSVPTYRLTDGGFERV